MRPVKIQKHILGYECPAYLSPFRFDMRLNYELPRIINKYNTGKPILVSVYLQ